MRAADGGLVYRPVVIFTREPGIDVELVVRVCRELALRDIGGAACEVRVDPLDGSVWVGLSSLARAEEAAAALAELGLSVPARDDARLRVTGWDARLLRRRLGVLLAGVDDLRVEWEATAELVMCHHDRRASGAETGEVGEWAVLADVEQALRTSVPFPRRVPRVDDVAALLELVDAAEAAYGQLIGEHVEFAEQTLTAYALELGRADPEAARAVVLEQARRRLAAA
jgi:hypothetical protein